MVFASGVAAVIALLALATPAKKNLDKANQGMKRMKPFPPFWDSLPTTVSSATDVTVFVKSLGNFISLAL